MNPNLEELLFQLALTKPVAERATWLDRECGTDPAPTPAQGFGSWFNV